MYTISVLHYQPIQKQKLHKKLIKWSICLQTINFPANSYLSFNWKLNHNIHAFIFHLKHQCEAQAQVLNTIILWKTNYYNIITWKKAKKYTPQCERDIKRTKKILSTCPGAWSNCWQSFLSILFRKIKFMATIFLFAI